MKNFGQRQGINKDLHVWSAQMGFSSVLMFHNLFIQGVPGDNGLAGSHGDQGEAVRR